jgi:hypothetical protein
MTKKKNRDLINTLLIFAAAGCMLISIGAIMQGRFKRGYHWLMLSFGCFFYYTYRRVQQKDQSED